MSEARGGGWPRRSASFLLAAASASCRCAVAKAPRERDQERISAVIRASVSAVLLQPTGPAAVGCNVVELPGRLQTPRKQRSGTLPPKSVPMSSCLLRNCVSALLENE